MSLVTRRMVVARTNLAGIAGPYTNFSDEGEYSYSTSFPQPILMGAAFDDALITQVATVISTEARAFNNANRCV
jgi:beta-D-xylosidase 4